MTRTKLYEIKVNLSVNQKKNLARALNRRETITLRLTKDSLSGSDTLHVPVTVVKRLQKNRAAGKGMEIKLSKTNIRKQVGGSLLTSLMKLAPMVAPIAKTVGLSALAGLASEGASQIVKKISGKGVEIPHSKLKQLIPHEKELTAKQRREINYALQTGTGVTIQPTKKQTGGFLGALLASIGVPLAIEAIKKVTGSGAPRLGAIPVQGGAAPRLGRYDPPPPFFGTWGRGIEPRITGKGKKKKGKKKGEGLLLGKNSPFNDIPLIGAIL